LSKKTFKVIKETNNDAIIQIKGNQKSIFELSEFICNNNPCVSSYQSCEKNRDRLETRNVEVYLSQAIQEVLNKDWNGISSIIKVERTRKPFNTKKKKYKETKKRVFYYLSTIPDDAKTVSKIIRGHWGIENKVNHVKDVQFKEDLSRIRVASFQFSIIRSFALNILRLNGAKKISRERRRNCMNINYIFNYKAIA